MPRCRETLDEVLSANDRQPSFICHVNICTPEYQSWIGLPSAISYVKSLDCLRLMLPEYPPAGR